jgi:hypothetical protein
MHSDKTSLKKHKIVSQVKNQMIIEAYGDFVRVKHVVSMRQVNPNKASRRKPNK